MKIEIKKSTKPVEYIEAIDFLEKRLVQINQKKATDLIWILEHPSIYTAGTSYNENEILDKSINVVKTNRGGKITYHGPGQTICYFVIDLNKRKFKVNANIKWFCNSAEKLPFKNNHFDYYTISFGMRNVSNLNKSLKEAYRVLKPGGRFLCLEFSKVQNSQLNVFYKKYSKLIPRIGELIVGEKKPYKYLIESIENFMNQEELIELMYKNNLTKCSYRNLSGGIVAIHSGWKI